MISPERKTWTCKSIPPTKCAWNIVCQEAVRLTFLLKFSTHWTSATFELRGTLYQDIIAVFHNLPAKLYRHSASYIPVRVVHRWHTQTAIKAESNTNQSTSLYTDFQNRLSFCLACVPSAALLFMFFSSYFKQLDIVCCSRKLLCYFLPNQQEPLWVPCGLGVTLRCHNSNSNKTTVHAMFKHLH